MNTKTKCALLIVAVLVGWLVWPKKETAAPADATSLAGDAPNSSRAAQRPRRTSHVLSPEEASSLGSPKGQFARIFDKARQGNRFLVAKARDEKFREHSDAASGMDLWFQDASGEERLIHGSVTRAKFSPDGSKVAFTTSDGDLHVEDVQGGKLAKVPGVYGPSWNPDGTAVIYSKVGDGQDVHRPGTRSVTSMNIMTGEVKSLTDGRFDDGRPEFTPSSDRVIFVSGARTGLASFWTVPAEGGQAVQLTNIGQQQVNELFVPTPYEQTIWSGDKRWFIYDFKSGDQEETWGLEFNSDGTFKKATKLADGINPRWQADGKTFVSDKTVDGSIQTIVSSLP